MKIIHNIASIGKKSFGLGPVALNLAYEQCLLGHDSGIICLDESSEVNWAAATCGLPLENIKNFRCSGPKKLMMSFEMEHYVRREILSKISIVHQHSILIGISRVTNILRKAHGIPIVIAPHASLEPWALNRSRWKKRLALALFERSNLKLASCIHACSMQEVSGIRSFGLTNPVAVIPNGISSYWLESKGSANTFRSQFDISKKKRIMLFLSRIAPVKGLTMMIEALNSIRDYVADWTFVLAGSDECGHLPHIKKMILDYGLQDSFVFTGLISGQTKRDAFAASEVFILPTLRENFAIAVVEALGAGIPVITTKGAPWEELVDNDCGWWSDVSAESLALSICDAVKKSPDELRAMGRRGRELVSSKYSWKQSAQMTIELYRWLLGQDRRPNFVIY